MVFDESEYRKKWRKDRAKNTREKQIAAGARFVWICERCGGETITSLKPEEDAILCRKCRLEFEREEKAKKIAKDVEDLRKRAGLK